MVSSNSVRGIAFDMDGVIVDTMPFHVIAWQGAFSKLNIFVSEQRIYIGEGVKGREFIEQINQEQNLNLSVETREQIYNHKKIIYNEVLDVRLIPNVEKVIEQAKKYQYRLSVVTGSNRDTALELLEKMKVLQFFGSIISGDDVIHGKPSPEPYLKAITQMNISASNCLVIENAPAGIQSAKAAGLFCIAVQTSLEKSYLADADLICNNLQEVHNLLMKERLVSSGLGMWRFSEVIRE